MTLPDIITRLLRNFRDWDVPLKAHTLSTPMQDREQGGNPGLGFEGVPAKSMLC